MVYQNVSLIVAFLGGMLTLLPACGPALLPAFFAYTFKSKVDLIRAAVYFGLGFGLLFLPFSLGLNFLADLLIDSRPLLFTIVGWILIIFGIFSLINFRLPIYLSSIPVIKKPWDAFFLGLVFGLTSAACIAPIYGAILSLSVLQSGFNQVLLLFSFTLGMIVPLIFLAYVFTKFSISSLNFFRPSIQLGPIKIFIANFFAAIIFISLGIFFILSKGGNPLFGFAQETGILRAFEAINHFLLEFNSKYQYLDICIAALLIIMVFVLFVKKNKS